MIGAVIVGGWSVAAVGLYCCTSLSGLDDKVFDLGSGGAGAGSSTGGSGGIDSPYKLAEPGWAVRFGGNGDETAAAVAVGPSGEIAVVGYFEGTLPLPGDCSQSNTNAGKLRIFIAKLNGPEDCAWSKSFGEFTEVPELDVAINGNGHIFVVGGFDGIIAANELTPTASHTSENHDAFFIEYEANGDFANDPEIYGGSGSQRLSGVAIGEDDNVFVVGHYELSFDLKGACNVQPFENGPADNVVVAQFGPAGTCQYAKGFDVDKEQFGKAVAPGNDGAVVFTGFTRGEMSFEIEGGAPFLYPEDGGDGADQDIYVAQIKLNPFEHQWSHRWGDTAWQEGRSVAVHPDTGDVFVTGRLGGTAVFADGGAQGSDGDDDAFLVRLSSDGGIQYGRSFGAPSTTQLGETVLPRPNGAVLLGGTYGGTLHCSGHDIGPAARAIFLARFGPDGTPEQCQSLTGSQTFVFADMAASGPQSVVLFGHFTEELTFGNIVLTSAASSQDLFLAEVDLHPGL